MTLLETIAIVSVMGLVIGVIFGASILADWSDDAMAVMKDPKQDPWVKDLEERQKDGK